MSVQSASKGRDDASERAARGPTEEDDGHKGGDGPHAGHRDVDASVRRIRMQIRRTMSGGQASTHWKRLVLAANARTAVRATDRERAPSYSNWHVGNKAQSKPHHGVDPIDAQAQSAKQERIRMRRILVRNFQDQRKRKQQKIQRLRQTYSRLHKQWRRHCERMDSILAPNGEGGFRRSAHSYNGQSTASAATGVAEVIEANIASSTQNTGQAASMLQNPSQQGTAIEEAPQQVNMAAALTRANRRNTQSGGLVGFGDAVRSEAEFLEILASLESADMQDPSVRAARTTAIEPDMMISTADGSDEDGDEAESSVRNENCFDDDNGFVADPVSFYLSDFDPDVWTEEEEEVFARRYALFPKRFGKIAQGLTHKTASQCVSYYYLTKKRNDYKSLLTSRNRDRRRKPKLVKPKKGRGSALMADLKVSTPIEEAIAEPEEEASPPEPDVPIATTSSARRTARGGGVTVAVHATPTEMPVTAAATVPVKEDVEGDPAEPSLPVEDANKQRSLPRQSTSSYWSVAERSEFLRSLAIVGRDWEALSRNLSTKSAAQARNYFVRNAEDADFMEAVQLARSNAALTLEERSEAADALVRRRAAAAAAAAAVASAALTTTNALSAQIASTPAIVEPTLTSSDASDASSAHGQRGRLNINALLNTESDVSDGPARRSSLNEWFGSNQDLQAAKRSEALSHERRRDIVEPMVRPSTSYTSDERIAPLHSRGAMTTTPPPSAARLSPEKRYYYPHPHPSSHPQQQQQQPHQRRGHQHGPPLPHHSHRALSHDQERSYYGGPAYPPRPPHESSLRFSPAPRDSLPPNLPASNPYLFANRDRMYSHLRNEADEENHPRR